MAGRKMKPLPKFFGLLAVVALIVFGGRWALQQAPKGKVQSAVANATMSKEFKGKTPINIGVVTWGGYAGGQYFNNGFKASTQSRYWKQYGLAVNFIVLDDYKASRDAWKAGKVDLLWGTADSYPTEVEALADFSPRIAWQADWSRGGDAIVVGRGINTVSDLRGKDIAVAYGTPSHSFILNTLKANNMTVRDVNLVEQANALDAAAAFKAGRVQAAVVWSPDDEDCVQAVTGAKVLVSTKTAGSIIADIFFGKQEWIDAHQTELKALIEGWMIGAAEINHDPAAKMAAAKILAAGLNQPEENMLKAINNVRLCTLGDNMNFFGLNTSYKGVRGEELYVKTGAMYAALNPPLAPKTLPPWRTVIDLTALRAVELTGSEHAAEGQATFTKATTEEANAPAFATKTVTINFPTGSAALTATAMQIIDREMVDELRMFRDARVRVEGNTDNVGGAEFNRALSLRRAQSVVDYLVNTYQFDRNKFIPVGNGMDNPVDINDTEAGRAANRRTDIKLLKKD